MKFVSVIRYWERRKPRHNGTADSVKKFLEKRKKDVSLHRTRTTTETRHGNR